jgi:hypothetical protein
MAGAPGPSMLFRRGYFGGPRDDRPEPCRARNVYGLFEQTHKPDRDDHAGPAQQEIPS